MRQKLQSVVLCAAAVAFLAAFRVEIKPPKIFQGRGTTSAQPAPTKATTPPATPEPSAVGGLCDASKSLGLCYVFSGAKNKEKNPQQGNQMACKLLRGNFAASGKCPEPSRLGKCTILAGQPGELVLFYYPVRLDATKAAADCTNPKSSLHVQGPGTWVSLR